MPYCLSTVAAVKVGGRRQPSQRLSTAVPIVASRSRLQLPGKVSSPKRFCLGKGESGQKPWRLWCCGRGELLPWGEHSGDCSQGWSQGNDRRGQRVLGLREREVKHRGVRLGDVLFPGKAACKEAEQI